MCSHTQTMGLLDANALLLVQPMGYPYHAHYLGCIYMLMRTVTANGVYISLVIGVLLMHYK